MPIGILPFEREEEGPRDLRARVGAYTGGITIEFADGARAHRLGGVGKCYRFHGNHFPVSDGEIQGLSVLRFRRA